MSPEGTPDVIARPVFPIDADRMHKFDPAMTELITDYVKERLAMADTSVDGLGDRQQLEEVMADLIGDGPRPAKEVLDIYVDHLAETILSSDSPRFFAFIPAAPTKAAVATRAVETTPSKKVNTAKKTVVQDQKKKQVKAKHVSTAGAYDMNAKAYKKRNDEVSRGLTMKQWTNGGHDWEFEIELIVINDYNQCNQYKKYIL